MNEVSEFISFRVGFRGFEKIGCLRDMSETAKEVVGAAIDAVRYIEHMEKEAQLAGDTEFLLAKMVETGHADMRHEIQGVKAGIAV